MKVLFVYPESGYNREDNISFKKGRYYHGIGVLSAFLKEKGHSTFLYHALNNVNQQDFINCVEEVLPDLICISSTSHMISEVIKLDEIINQKYSDIPSIIGGSIISVEPELINRFTGINAGCIGDGELALSEILENINKGKKDIFEDISNVIKKGYTKNIKVNCITDLDLLPFGDRELFRFSEIDDYEWFKRLPMYTSRGCDSACVFCSNSAFRKYYNNNEYLRFRSVDNVIYEIKDNLKKYPDIESIQFQSDMFFQNKKWLREFAEKYREINIPYHCVARVESIDEEIISLLKKSGCELVLMGVEAGDEKTRKKIGKEESSKKIIEKFNMLKKQGLKTGTFNIMGLPDEKISSLIKLLRLNAIISPDLSQISIYYPYKNTALYNSIAKYIKSTDLSYKTYFEASLIKEEHLLKDFYYYYLNFLEFVEIYKNTKKKYWPFIDILIRFRIIPEFILKKVKCSIFRIIF